MIVQSPSSVVLYRVAADRQSRPLYGNFGQVEVLKIEWISRSRSVEGFVTHQPDDDASDNLTREEFFVIHIHQVCANCQGLTHHLVHRILRSCILQRLRVCQKDGW